MGSPSGIYTSLTPEQLDELEEAAFARLRDGAWTSISGGQKSGTKQFQNPNEMLAEIKYARQKLGIIPQRVTKTYMDTVNPPYPASVPNEQV